MELIIERCLQLSDKDQRNDLENKCDSIMLPDEENERVRKPLYTSTQT
jgi:hypothetical protein